MWYHFLNYIGKTTVFKRTQLNKDLQEAALVFPAISKSHEGIAWKKAMSIIFNGNTDYSLNSLRHKTLI